MQPFTAQAVLSEFAGLRPHLADSLPLADPAADSEPGNDTSEGSGSDADGAVGEGSGIDAGVGAAGVAGAAVGVPVTVPEAVLAAMVEIGSRFGPRAVRQLRPAMLARFGADGLLDRFQDRAHVRRGLSFGIAGDGLMLEYRLVLDQVSAAIFEAALGPGSAPDPHHPGNTTDTTDTTDAAGAVTGRATSGDVRLRDARTVAQRRADALMGLLEHAVAHRDEGGGASTTKLIVTMPYADLRDQVRAATVEGTLQSGVLIGPDTARRLACDAGILPAVLGARGATLDFGRERRAFTGRQRAAILLRDRQCTFPGCTAPAAWSQVHHTWHWADGGPTDTGYGALLCQAHHTIVHRDKLMAHLDTDPDTGRQVMHWDTTPGSYDTWLRHQRHRAEPLNAEDTARQGSPPGGEDADAPAADPPGRDTG